VRLIKVGLESVKAPIEKFEPVKTRDAIARFGQYLKTQGGAAAAEQGASEAEQMLGAALNLLEDFKKVVATGKDVYVRRLTEAEAGAESAMSALRNSLQGPRIILA
jgi:type IV secretory pathway TrbL component